LPKTIRSAFFFRGRGAELFSAGLGGSCEAQVLEPLQVVVWRLMEPWALFIKDLRRLSRFLAEGTTQRNEEKQGEGGTRMDALA